MGSIQVGGTCVFLRNPNRAKPRLWEQGDSKVSEW
jgi:hypothetical protein